MTELIEEMKAVMFVQQQLIMDLQNKLKDSEKCIEDLGTAIYEHDSEDCFGIIVNDMFKLIMNTPYNDNIIFDLSDIYSDIEYIFDYDDYECFDMSFFEELISLYDIKISGHFISSVCCREERVIMPKSYDLQGITELNKLRDELVKAGRIDDEKIGFLRKRCHCT